MTQRIAPNNNIPATHFIEVIKYLRGSTDILDADKIVNLQYELESTKQFGHKTLAIFRIRENKLPTLHNFSK